MITREDAPPKPSPERVGSRVVGWASSRPRSCSWAISSSTCCPADARERGPSSCGSETIAASENADLSVGRLEELRDWLEAHNLESGEPGGGGVDAALFETVYQGLRRGRRHPVMRYVAAAKTDVGRKRQGNEDSFCLAPDLGLYVVADGMGGHAAGEVASRLAVETIREWMGKYLAATRPSSGSAARGLAGGDTPVAASAWRTGPSSMPPRPAATTRAWGPQWWRS